MALLRANPATLNLAAGPKHDCRRKLAVPSSEPLSHTRVLMLRANLDTQENESVVRFLRSQTAVGKFLKCRELLPRSHKPETLASP